MLKIFVGHVHFNPDVGTLLRHIAQAMPACNPDNLSGDVFGRQNKIDTAANDGTRGHMRLARGVAFLRDGNSAQVFDAAQGIGAVAIVARDDNGDPFSIPVFSD